MTRATRHPYTTKLDQFINRHNLKPSTIARAAGCSRQHLLRLRKGEMDPTRGMMATIAHACGRLIGRDVAVDELFEF